VSDERSILDGTAADKDRQLQQVTEAAMEERLEFDRIMGEMSDKIQQLEEQLGGESQEWKSKYEELYARVEPFLEQLDAFATERSLLLGINVRSFISCYKRNTAMTDLPPLFFTQRSLERSTLLREADI
jgi:hypothetical protein